jgi:hypothetical protein
VVEHDLPVDDDQVEAERIGEGSLEGRGVDHPLRIEDHEVGEGSGADDSEVRHAEALSRQ